MRLTLGRRGAAGWHAKVRWALAGAAFALAPPAPAGADLLEEARQVVARASAPGSAWAGPTTGPSAQPGKRITVLAEDLRNGGVLGVAQGIREAARVIGWDVRVVDAGGTASGRKRALEDVLATKPDGLVVCGSDAGDIEPSLQASARPMQVVGWHAGPVPGPIAGTSVAMNVTTDPIAVARTTALAAVDQSGGRAGVVVFTDSRFGIATAKANAMADVVRRCGGCTLLDVLDVPISDSAARMPDVVRRLMANHGARWTHALAINDIYFDYAVPVFIAMGVAHRAVELLSAGDGSAPAFMRIRAGSYQTGTVAEPLNMQGWQIVDELNRLFAGQPVSGFVAPVHLVTPQNIGTEGGARRVYDPDNGYRDVYRRIWEPR
ncbi:substrate-binding domain-containing protein [Piscinibacter sp.]|uniref:substrate-binding domain-containing protein n=1 Tax=Piscinibacter sp. TaxID=1903157 RepID=UPI002C6D4950|nr:substrate-binding domain-containing protein [Albitalea sp.]HUG22917.1 substrate-binding domain-containing protein [Albitalea sp.]